MERFRQSRLLYTVLVFHLRIYWVPFTHNILCWEECFPSYSVMSSKVYNKTFCLFKSIPVQPNFESFCIPSLSLAPTINSVSLPTDKISGVCSMFWVEAKSLKCGGPLSRCRWVVFCFLDEPSQCTTALDACRHYYNGEVDRLTYQPPVVCKKRGWKWLLCLQDW